MNRQQKPDFRNFKQFQNQNFQVCSELHSRASLKIMPHQISSIKQNKNDNSIISNIFQNSQKQAGYANIPISIKQNNQNQNCKRQSHTQKQVQQEPYWKLKYQELYRSYELMARKCEVRTKEVLRLQQNIKDQSIVIKQLQQQNAQLINKLNCQYLKSQENQMWQNNYSTNCGQDISNSKQANKFYVQQLEKSIQNLQIQNRRLSDIIMRKVKNSFHF